MALHHESAGNSAASGNAATPGTSSLVQARDTRSAGAFFVSTLEESLFDQSSYVADLCRQLEVALEIIKSDREDAAQVADALTCVALHRLRQISLDLESLSTDCGRMATKLESGHA